MTLRKSVSYLLVISSVILLGSFFYLSKHLEYDFPRAATLWGSFVSFYLYRAINYSPKSRKILAALFPIFLLGLLEIPWGIAKYNPSTSAGHSNLYAVAEKRSSNKQPNFPGLTKSVNSRTQGDVDTDYHLAWLGNKYYGDGIRFIEMPRNYKSESLNTNSLGFRSPEFTEKPKNTYRILILGGSAAFGVQAPTDSSIVSYQLELLLNANRTKGKRYEVLNLGVPNGISWTDYAVFGTYGISLDPDMALFLAGPSDLAGNADYILHVSKIIKTELSEKKTAYLLKRAFAGGSLIALRAIHRIYSLDFILAKFFGTNYWWGKWIWDDKYQPKYTQKDYDFFRKKYFEKLEGIYRLGKSAGIDIVTFHVPHLSTSLHYKKRLVGKENLWMEVLLSKNRSRRLFYVNYVKRLPGALKKGKELAERYNFEYIDLTRIFDNHTSVLKNVLSISHDPNGPMFVSASHWSGGGNKRVAEAIFKAIKGKIPK